MPASFAPKCSQQWLAKQYPKLLAFAQYMSGLSEFDVAGHRMELRIGPCNDPSSNWQEQLQQLQGIFKEASKLLFAKPLPLVEMVEGMKVALSDAEIPASTKKHHGSRAHRGRL